jgi:hypothetical protein
VLDSGGQIDGTLVNTEESPRTTYVIRLGSGGQITLAGNRVVEHQAESEKLRQYNDLLPQMSDTVSGHLKMAEWCKAQSLTQQREFHLEQVLRHDTDHEEARRLLNYQRTSDGAWITEDERMQARGYVRHKGKWQLPQHQAIEEAKAAAEEAQVRWYRDVRMWRKWLGGTRHDQAVEQLRAIRDPLAAEALAKAFAEEGNTKVKEFLAVILSQLGSRRATAALIDCALGDSDREMRLYCLDQLKQRGRSQAITAFTGALSGKDRVRINRAAEALGKLDGSSAILPLIEVLQTQQKVRVNVASGPGNLNPSFQRDATGRPSGGGFGAGNATRVITQTVDNKSVLNALVALTGENFKYSQADWKRWYLRSNTPPEVNLRRDL